jgi:NTP pyrophosphatase (non-canonical NTP hydrolase)
MAGFADLRSVRSVEINEFQARMDAIFGEKDRQRGLPAAVAHLAEEVGELARAVRKGTSAEQLHELGDVFAWTASIAHQLGLSLEEAAGRYDGGCPRCSSTPCACSA